MVPMSPRPVRVLPIEATERTLMQTDGRLLDGSCECGASATRFPTSSGSKAPWFEITDDLPQFEELPA